MHFLSSLSVNCEQKKFVLTHKQCVCNGVSMRSKLNLLTGPIKKNHRKMECTLYVLFMACKYAFITT